MFPMSHARTRSPGPDRVIASAVPSCIDKDDILAFNLERERRLTCNNGLLWVTVQDDRNDYLLEGRRELHVPGGRKIIVQAEEPSCFQVD